MARAAQIGSGAWGAAPGEHVPPVDREIEGARVVVVDDSEDNLDWMSLALHEAGAQVRGAASAREAWEMVAAGDVDVVVSDLSMPDKAGYWLVRMMRASTKLKRVPALAVSAYSTSQVAGAASAAGFDAFLQKPLDPTTLVTTVRALLHQAGVR